MANQGTVRVVICEFVDGALPNVTIKYDLADPDNPALGTITGVQREIQDTPRRQAIYNMAASLVQPTSTELNIPLGLPAGPPAQPPG